MFQRAVSDRGSRQTGAGISGGWHWRQWIILLLLAAGIAPGRGQDLPPAARADFSTSLSGPFLTNTVQFKTLPPGDYLEECAFHLEGVVTLVDTNRSLLVVQDATGALALHFDFAGSGVQVGQSVSLSGTNCFPYVAAFPDYPYRPSGSEIRNAFEGPTNWGEYYLARMRGYLHPPATGEYTFWIASDNSSELWLSPDESPSQARKIAFIPQFGWASPDDWTKYPSERSETIYLRAGETYYIEALQEQTTKADNLAVAWQGPGLAQSVIDGGYLSPWTGSDGENRRIQTNGILREYWTNYSAGDLTILSVSSPFASAVTVKRARVSVVGPGKLPAATVVDLSQPLPADKDFCWSQVEGVVTFAGVNGSGADFELSDGAGRVPVRILGGDPALLRRLGNLPVRIQGVCEAGYDRNNVEVPGVIWVPAEKFVAPGAPDGTNLNAIQEMQVLNPMSVNSAPTMQGFYGTRGVVTFNDRVMGQDYLYVQEDTAAISVSLKDRHFESHLEVGQCVDLGGSLRPGKYISVMDPMVVKKVGWRSLPVPITQLGPFPVPGSKDGRWTELEGVVHSVNSDGTLSLSGKDGLVHLWLGKTPPNDLDSYVDAKLRVRGVLNLALLNAPMLLIPSRDFVEVEEAPARNPFKLPVCPIAEVGADPGEYALAHRVRIRGEVIYHQGGTILMQDSSGGVRVQVPGAPAVAVGQTAEAIGFPGVNGSASILTEAALRVADQGDHYGPQKLDLTKTLFRVQATTLVQVTATLLNQSTRGGSQLLELEESKRIFTATLPAGDDKLPAIPPGSRVRVTGVFENEDLIPAPTPNTGTERPTAGSLNILLRGPSDVVVLSGPPWWTLKRTVALVSTLLAVLAVALLWVHLLRRRLARQQAARLAFSRQILRGQESERQRIAVNLHDSLGQNLLVIKNQARLAMQFAGDETDRQNRLNKISEITSQAIEEVRQITRDLRPYQLDRLGLTQAIRAVVNQASENSSILTAISLDTIDGLFDKESEIHVYRIVQEAFTNILRHSGATEAAIVVKNLGGFISVSIRDNGHGFDPGVIGSVADHDPGYGLNGMKERARILGGRLVLESRPDMGTSISIEIPKPIAKL